MSNLASLVAHAEIDHRALLQPIKVCDLAQCRGTCCHDGVYLSGEEATVVRELVGFAREDFLKIGADLPEQVVVYGKFRDLASGPKTATRPAPMHDWVPDYPTHFADTNCVFLLPDAKCALQAYSMDQGIDPWHYKPFTCWIHPLSFVKNKSGGTTLTLHSEESDPHQFEDYDGFCSKTHCGRICENGGVPAYEALSGELKRLGEIGSRDLIMEIREKIDAED